MRRTRSPTVEQFDSSASAISTPNADMLSKRSSAISTSSKPRSSLNAAQNLTCSGSRSRKVSMISLRRSNVVGLLIFSSFPSRPLKFGEGAMSFVPLAGDALENGAFRLAQDMRDLERVEATLEKLARRHLAQLVQRGTKSTAVLIAVFDGDVAHARHQ